MAFLQVSHRAAALVAIVLLVFLVARRQHSHLTSDLIDGLIQASTPTGAQVSIDADAFSWTHDSLLANLLRPNSMQSETIPPTSLQYLQPLLRCPRGSNPDTAHVRLPAPLLNISLNPIDIQTEPEPHHFNPTIVPLPSYSASFTPARYLLITRLVTPGLHQESLACLATFCLPQKNKTSTRLPPDTVPCTSADVMAIRSKGGMRCVTKPTRLNIPPTPAKQCTGEWARFPDIPGFHDPRVMWSGTGEPLIVVNSASTYSCIGLWVMDLRPLLPELKAVMEHRAPALAVETDHNNIRKRAQDGSEKQDNHYNSLPVLRYQILTELTRWEGRSEVEKNWILWFPGHEGETWISYDSFGQWKPAQEPVREDQKHGEALKANGSQSDREGQYDQQHFLPLIPPWPAMNNSNDTQNRNTDSIASIRAQWSTSLTVTTRNTTNSTRNIHHDSSTNLSSQQNSTSINHQPIKRSPNQPRETIPILPPSPHPWTFHGGRSISKLIGHGYTTPNLTSPHESPCLTPSSFADPLGNIGHFHQSTPALTLILCERSALSNPSTYPLQRQANSSSSSTTNISNSCATATPHTYTRDGLTVHFALMHRKFSDGALGMPLRYERWAVVWEGRYPFRILGVSRHPIAFKGEMVRPWSRAENGLPEEEEEEEGVGLGKVGFTYTTSIAWAWRPASAVMAGWEGEEEEGAEDAEQLARLGVGFLGDDVIVGVGLDDVAQAVVRVNVDELLGCLRLCPGVGGAE